MPINTENNYAFIDSQNFNLGILEMGWKLDYRKFRKYLYDKYAVKTAYIFIGLVPANQGLYNSLQKAGFVLVYKPTISDSKGKLKGNVDAELVLQAMIDIDDYDKAIIVTSDGDFHCLVGYLQKKGKLRIVLSPNNAKCSTLLPRAALGNIAYMNELDKKLKLINT